MLRLLRRSKQLQGVVAQQQGLLSLPSAFLTALSGGGSSSSSSSRASSSASSASSSSASSGGGSGGSPTTAASGCSKGSSSKSLLPASTVSEGYRSRGWPASETKKRANVAGRQRRKLDASQPVGALPPPERVPLHACLRAAGITDVGPFSAASHLALSEEAVRREVQPKLAAFQAEGLGPEGMAKLLCARRQAVLWCNYTAVFQPNWRVLQQIVPHMQRGLHPSAPQRTALGAALARGPDTVAQYLVRDPQLTQQLLAWLEGSFGIGPQQLAVSYGLFRTLQASVPAASAVTALLQQQGVPAAEVGSVFLRKPSLFQFKPATLDAKLGVLQRELDMPAAEALRLVLQQPRLLTTDLAARLAPLLAFLDGYMGQPGRGGGWC